MKLKISFFLLLCLMAIQSGAQSYFYNNDYYDNAITYEAGISLGPMNSMTDVGGRPGFGTRGPKDLNIKSTTLYGSIYASAVYKHFLALRMEATIGRIKSNDSLLDGIKSPNKAIGRYNRNLSFRSPIYEISLTAEFHPIDFFSNFDPDRYAPALSPYLTQINIPLGIGIAYEVSPKLNFRLEYINRKSFTDYLDDVHDTYIDPALFSKYLSGTELSQALILNNRRRSDAVENQTTARAGGRRGNPLNNDSYFTINFKAGYVFGRDKNSSGGGRGGASGRKLWRIQKNQRSCPTLY